LVLAGAGITVALTGTSTGSIESNLTAAKNTIDTTKLNSISNPTTYDKVKAIHDYVCENVTYADGNISIREYQTPYSFFNDVDGDSKMETVCAGYAKVFKLLCGKYNIPCILVSGEGVNSSGSREPHMWNYVKLSGNWYAVDCTWDDQDKSNKLLDDYLLAGSDTVDVNFSKESFSSTHISSGVWSNDESYSFTYPSLSSDKYVQETGTYTLTFDVNGGDELSDTDKTKSVTYDAAYGDLPTPTKTGFDFDGWYTATEGGSKVTSTDIYITADDSTLYAHWTGSEHTVTFDANGGNFNGSEATKKVRYDSQYGTLPTPTKTGYVFEGWFTAAEGGTQIKTDSVYNTDGDVTLYAHWSPNSYTVTYDLNGAVSVDVTGLTQPSKTITYGSNYGELPALSQIDYRFDGWYTAAEGGSKVTSSTKYTTADNSTLYAHWTQRYEVEFYLTEGNFGRGYQGDLANWGIRATERIYVYLGDKFDDNSLVKPVLIDEAKTTSGYYFINWKVVKANGEKVTVDNNTTITADFINASGKVKLVPEFGAKTYIIKCTTKNGDSINDAIKTINVTYGEEITDFPSAQDYGRGEGYRVTGWALDLNTYSDNFLDGDYVCVIKTSDLYQNRNDVFLAYPTIRPKEYTVTYDVNGGDELSESEKTSNIEYDKEFGTLVGKTANRTGYNFEGWYSQASGGTKIESTTKYTTAGNSSIYAHWTPKGYTLTYDVNGGNALEPTTKSITYDSKLGTLSTPTRDGYSFAGWYTEATNGTKIDENYICNGPLTVYAHWDKIEYTVTFNVNGGDALPGSSASKIVDYNSTYGELPTPTRQGYVFKGWYTDATSGTRIYTDTVCNATITLYAHWAAKYTITLNGNEGSVTPTSIEVEQGKTYTNLPTPTRTGYVFAGWYTDATSGTKVENTDTATASIELFAHWTVDPDIHTLSFDVNGEGVEAVASISIRKGNAYITGAGDLPTATREGYTFDGWFTQAAGGTKVSKDTVCGDRDVTVYAHWTAKPYTLTFDVNGGDALGSNTQASNYDAAYGTLPTATRTGYKFEGWFTSINNSGSKVTSTTVCKGDLTVYAHWSINKYTVTYDVNGGNELSESSKQVEHGSVYGDLPTPSKTGHTFDGWYTSANGGTKIESTSTCTAAITIYAHWSKEQYTIAFDLNGGEGANPASISVYYGDAYNSLPSAGTKTGYDFVGWYTAASGGTKIENTSICTLSGTLYAHWTAKSCTITLDVNGGDALASTSINSDYDSAYGTLPSPTRTGYDFAGWFTTASGGSQVTSATICAGDTTIYAHWNSKPYSITLNVNGGNALSNPSVSAYYDGSYGTLPTPTKTGYDFTGWFTAANGGTQVTAATVCKGSATIYAQWTAKNCTIILNVNGGDPLASPSINAYYDSAYGTLDSPTRYGYTFEGWFTAVSGGSQVTSATICAGDTTLYAHWNRVTYTITYNVNGGNALSETTKSVGEGDAYGVLLTPTKIGHNFDGWFTAAVGGDEVSATTVCTEAKTIYAHWTAATYTITLNTNGGNTLASDSIPVTFGTPYGSLPDASSVIRVGYRFDGWSSSQDSVTPNITNTTMMNTPSNHTIYAVWTKKDQQKIEEAILVSVPEAVKASFPTTESMVNKVVEHILEVSGQASDSQAVEEKKENIHSVVKDIELMLSTDYGQNWVEATPENFPVEGLEVKIDYPEGAPANAIYNVAHIFEHTNGSGKMPGDVEYPTVFKDSDGIRFRVTGLSPVVITWEIPATETVSDNSSTRKQNNRFGFDLGSWYYLNMLLNQNNSAVNAALYSSENTSSTASSNSESSNSGSGSSSNSGSNTATYVEPPLVSTCPSINYSVVKQEQGLICKTVFALNRPSGYVEAFSVNILKDGKTDYSKKDGKYVIVIPEAYRKSGRSFAVIGVDKFGLAKIYLI